MAGSFREVAFADLDVRDPFFESLRSDYAGFDKWFTRKAALAVVSDQGIDAFLYLKNEVDEPVPLVGAGNPSLFTGSICDDRHFAHVGRAQLTDALGSGA